MGLAIPEATGVAPAEWVHGTMWKKSEKYARAVETNDHMMIHMAPVEPPVPSGYEGG